jgi:hypothetical protein
MKYVTLESVGISADDMEHIRGCASFMGVSILKAPSAMPSDHPAHRDVEFVKELYKAFDEGEPVACNLAGLQAMMSICRSVRYTFERVKLPRQVVVLLRDEVGITQSVVTALDAKLLRIIKELNAELGEEKGMEA